MSIILAAYIVLQASNCAVLSPPAEGLLLWFDAGDIGRLDINGDRVNSWRSKAGVTECIALGAYDQRPRWI